MVRTCNRGHDSGTVDGAEGAEFQSPGVIGVRKVLAVVTVTISAIVARYTFLGWRIHQSGPIMLRSIPNSINFAPTASHPAHDQQVSSARVPHSLTSSSPHPYISLPTSTSQQVTHIASELSSHSIRATFHFIRRYPTTSLSSLRLESEPYSTCTAHITQLFSLVS